MTSQNKIDRERLLAEFKEFESRLQFDECTGRSRLENGKFIIDYNSTGVIGYNRDAIITELDYLTNRKLIRQGSSFLDLGSGIGYNPSIAAHMDFESYGIELNKFLSEIISPALISMLREKGLLQDNIPRIIWGSYYPEEYIERRKRGKSLALEEEKLKDTRGLPLWSSASGYLYPEMKIFFPVGNARDIYKDLGKPISDIDIFFLYAWMEQIPSVLEMFHLYAKEDATLLMYLFRVPERMPAFLDHLDLTADHNDLSSQYEGLAESNIVRIRKFED